MDKVKRKKLFKMSWRGSPREATGLIRNGAPSVKIIRTKYIIITN